MNIWKIIFIICMPVLLFAGEKFPVQLLGYYSPLEGLFWNLNFSKNGKKPYSVWVARQLKIAGPTKNIELHTTHKSAKGVQEVLVVIGQDTKARIYIDLNSTGLVRPIVSSSFKIVRFKDIPKTVKCDNEALSIFTEAGIEVYFCMNQGQLSFNYDKDETP